ncbi:hypothetical protein [Streptomyces cinnamoneus]|uniref:Uncharacterized protein n=1 Tax=Streptomyces cinnamoneus TaxID=53446 RepID=A0A918TWX9_STRCJ|nr:hypothetical protein [Streptomyces cinnamoneus]GHC65569.1 hypothetical protein GCM10010507_49030 [Streptomyces cinnamoneus]
MSGGGGGDGIEASKAALRDVAKSINAAIGEMKTVSGPGAAAVGRGFDELALSGLVAGHEGLAASLKTFCNRWDWGVRALVQDASEFAHRVGLAAGYYQEVDQYLKDTFKVTVNAAMGNPHLTEDQVEAMSVKDVLADNPVTAIRDADYSDESFATAGKNAKESWSRTVDDLKSSTVVPGSPQSGYKLARDVASKIEDYR